MKKTIFIAFFTSSLLVANDYLPLSKIEDDKKLEYNFITLDNKVIKTDEVNTKSTVSNKENKIVQEIPNTKKETIKKEIVLEKEVNDYKKDNILQNRKINTSINSSDFTITPKVTYSYMTTDNYVSGKVAVVDKKNVVMPELAVSYKKHTLKAETMSVKTYFNSVIIGGNDLEMKNSWSKLSYLYKYQNVNLGLAYNLYKLKGNFIFNNVNYFVKDEQKFPSLELHVKNEEDKMEVNYGLSYGKNSDIDYAYQYYLNLGYKIFNNNLVLTAGYQNKTIEIGNIRFQHKGPAISLGGTF